MGILLRCAGGGFSVIGAMVVVAVMIKITRVQTWHPMVWTQTGILTLVLQITLQAN
jgi:hypothetical protein